MLGFSEDLKLAYRLKELFYCVSCGYQYVLTQPNRVRAAKTLREWIKGAEESNLKEFKSCITALMKYVTLLIILGLMVLLKELILR